MHTVKANADTSIWQHKTLGLPVKIRHCGPIIPAVWWGGKL